MICAWLCFENVRHRGAGGGGAAAAAGPGLLDSWWAQPFGYSTASLTQLKTLPTITWTGAGVVSSSFEMLCERERAFAVSE
jgi:hypothetical protein